MKNFSFERPTTKLHGRPLFSSYFVADRDLKYKVVLDIGCGYGWFEIVATKRGSKKVVGLELTHASLKIARRYVKSPKAAFVTGNVLKLPFASNTFDTVVLWEVLEHVSSGTEEEAIAEIRRVQKRGGATYLSCPFDSWISKLLDPAWWLTGHRHYKRDPLLRFFHNYGYNAEKVAIRGGWWSMARMLNFYLAKWVFRREPFFSDYFDKMLDQEYSLTKGFTNIFIKLKKT